MADTILMTGVPGFIGKRLARVLAQKGDVELVFLVQGRFRPGADKFVESLKGTGTKAKLGIVEGDITLPKLGLAKEALDALRARVTHAYHLAAAYDLRLAEDVGKRVNVEGTRNFLDAIEGAPAFKRLGYVSTCFIAGDRRGRFGEEDFDVGQKFKNFYESTKFEAERIVRDRWGRLPTTIFRPTVVAGDSETGEAEKIDGPYYAFVMVERGTHLLLANERAKFHITPVDFVAQAMVAILERPDAVGRTFHLADPSSLTFNEFFDLVADAFGKRRPILHIPPALMRRMIKVPGVVRLTGAPAQAFHYSLVPIDFTCDNTLRALEGTGIRCPPFASYLPKLVEYWRAHLSKEATSGPRW